MSPMARQPSSPAGLRQSRSGNLQGFDKELFKTIAPESLQKKLELNKEKDFLLIMDLTANCFPKTEAFNPNWQQLQIAIDYFTDVVCTHHMDRQVFYDSFKDQFDLSDLRKAMKTSESCTVFIRNGQTQKVVQGVIDVELKAAFKANLPPNPTDEDA